MPADAADEIGAPPLVPLCARAHVLTDPCHCSCGYGFSNEASAIQHVEGWAGHDHR